MDRSLDEIIAERRREGVGVSNGRRLISKIPRAVQTHRFTAERRLGACAGKAECYWETESTLSVSNLSFDITNEELYELFSSHGTLKRWELLENPATHRPSGRAEIVYEDSAHAEQAIVQLDGALVRGRLLRMSLGAPSRTRINAGRRHSAFDVIEVSNLPDNATEEEMEKVFARVGEIRSSKIEDRMTPDGLKERVFLVTYQSEEDAFFAVKEFSASSYKEKTLQIRMGSNVAEE